MSPDGITVRDILHNDCGPLLRRVQRADLPRNSIGLHSRLDRAAARVTEPEEHLDAEDGDSVFETRDDFRRDDITGDTRDKDIADGLIKHEFDGHARVGTGEDGGKGLSTICQPPFVKFYPLCTTGSRRILLAS